MLNVFVIIAETASSIATWNPKIFSLRYILYLFFCLYAFVIHVCVLFWHCSELIILCLYKDELLKLADLGSCRGIYSKPPFTEYISTRWWVSEFLIAVHFYFLYPVVSDPVHLFKHRCPSLGTVHQNACWQMAITRSKWMCGASAVWCLRLLGQFSANSSILCH